MVTYKRYEVYLISLDPTVGSEMKKTRPGVIISPDEMNQFINTVIIAPMTSNIRDYPTRLKVKFQHKEGQIVLDQIRSVDKQRLVKKLGSIDTSTASKLTKILIEMFS